MAKKKWDEMMTDDEPKPKRQTKPRDPEDLGRTISFGVGRKEGEVAEIDDIARGLGFTRNAIMGWLIRYCLREIRAGNLSIPVETETRRKLGD